MLPRQLIVDIVASFVIAATVGALAYPFAQAQLFKARQAEAKNNLVLIYTLQQSYRQAHGVYKSFENLGATSTEAFGSPNKKTALGKSNRRLCADPELGFKLEACERARYGYASRVDGDADGFVAVARAPSGAIIPDCKAEDVWEINASRRLRAQSDQDVISMCKL